MSQRVVVRGGLPGTMRVEVEGTDMGVDISTALTAYQAAHELADFMNVLLLVAPEPPKKNSKAPPKGDES